jgi:hypothetical protein
MYPKVEKVLYGFLDAFFKSHLDTLFLHFEFDIIINLLGILESGLHRQTLDALSTSTSALHAFQSFLFKKISKTTTKPNLKEKMCLFLERHRSVRCLYNNII